MLINNMNLNPKIYEKILGNEIKVMKEEQLDCNINRKSEIKEIDQIKKQDIRFADILDRVYEEKTMKSK